MGHQIKSDSILEEYTRFQNPIYVFLINTGSRSFGLKDFEKAIKLSNSLRSLISILINIYYFLLFKYEGYNNYRLNWHFIINLDCVNSK